MTYEVRIQHMFKSFSKRLRQISCTDSFFIFARTTFVMDTKLTLKIDQKIIEKAKKYASDKKLSLSNLIENYLNSLTSDKKNTNEIEISPFIKSLTTGSKIPANYDYKQEYSNYLVEKYK